MTEKSNPTNGFAKDVSDRMLKHMNDDHVDAMCDYCSFADVTIGNGSPKMTSVDQDGFDLLVNEKRVRFHFKKKCSTPEDVRKALVELAERSRAKKGSMGV